MSCSQEQALSKVPEVTLIFRIIKIAATTLGETAGDAVSMSMNLGYLVGTALFATIFFVSVAVQVKAGNFHPFPYWTTIIATLCFCDIISVIAAGNVRRQVYLFRPDARINNSQKESGR